MFDTAMKEAALFKCRRGHRKHLWAKLTAKLTVRNSFIRSNRQVTCSLGV